MQNILLSDIAAAVGCDTMADGSVGRVVTDSREAGPDALFVAIVGERLDGNDFTAAALAAGAPMALVSRVADGVDAGRVLVVPDTKRALIAIGGLYRSRFSLPAVGVTGSVGKTTTKEFIHAVLSAKYNTHKNEGNQNNELGVPNTLFALTEQHQAAVIEMGMSGLGEIRDLTLAVRPAVGVITSIGVSHIERLGSRENILKAKLELLEGMPDGAPLFLCGDNDLLSQVRDKRLKLFFYGVTNPRNDVSACEIESDGSSTRFVIRSPWGEYPAKIPTVGQHNLLNALAAFGVGCVMGVEPAAAAAALADYRPAGMRQRMVPWRGATIVEDCYNCSPDSLRAAVLALGSTPASGKRILVLSDMLELGERAGEMHAECGAFAARQDVDVLMACGELSRYTVDGANAAGMERCLYYETKEQLAGALLQAVRPGDVVWFKASRGMSLEDVIQRLYDGERGEG